MSHALFQTHHPRPTHSPSPRTPLAPAESARHAQLSRMADAEGCRSHVDSSSPFVNSLAYLCSFLSLCSIQTTSFFTHCSSLDFPSPDALDKAAFKVNPDSRTASRSGLRSFRLSLASPNCLQFFEHSCAPVILWGPCTRSFLSLECSPTRHNSAVH